MAMQPQIQHVDVPEVTETFVDSTHGCCCANRIDHRARSKLTTHFPPISQSNYASVDASLRSFQSRSLVNLLRASNRPKPFRAGANRIFRDRYSVCQIPCYG